MQSHIPSSSAPLTVRGDDGKPHLLSDLKGEAKPVKPQTRIRPIVPPIFRAPD